jgi:hypothetical protein
MMSLSQRAGHNVLRDGPVIGDLSILLVNVEDILNPIAP